MTVLKLCVGTDDAAVAAIAGDICNGIIFYCDFQGTGIVAAMAGDIHNFHNINPFLE